MMDKNVSQSETPIIFLAMFWGGGGPYTIAQVIHVYDWINRDIPSRGDLELALNTLLSMDFITVQDGKYKIKRGIGVDFDTYRKKMRKNKFKTARMYFKMHAPPVDIPKVIRISEASYAAAYAHYMDAFDC